MSILVTGAAGFIGSHVCHELLTLGYDVIAIDNINDYYDSSLKQERLNKLQPHHSFAFYQANIANKDSILQLADKHPNISIIIHLAAQAGVSHSTIDPYSYVESNVMGHVVLNELARCLVGLRHFIYASSSSVYGGNEKIPFSINDPVDNPVSLYAATKRADELISHSYSHLYNIPSTGLRFFTVYGPWGRPDMAYFIFTKAIMEGKPITVYGDGKMQRDFTYIDDIVSGIIKTMDAPPAKTDGNAPHQVLNLGNNKAIEINRLIEVIEDNLGKKAQRIDKPARDVDVPITYADITESKEILGYEPMTSIEEGIPKFIDWYKEYYNIDE